MLMIALQQIENQSSKILRYSFPAQPAGVILYLSSHLLQEIDVCDLEEERWWLRDFESALFHQAFKLTGRGEPHHWIPQIPVGLKIPRYKSPDKREYGLEIG